MDIIVTITYINGDYDTFDVYVSSTHSGSNPILYANNIPKNTLTSGYTISGVSEFTKTVILISNSNGCNGNTTIIPVLE